MLFEHHKVTLFIISKEIYLFGPLVGQLLDNLLRPPPPPSGVSLEDRIAEEIVDSLTTASRRKRDTGSHSNLLVKLFIS